VKFLSAKAIASFDTRALRSEYNRFYHKGNKDWWKTIFQIIRPILSGNSRVQQGIGLLKAEKARTFSNSILCLDKFQHPLEGDYNRE